MFVCDNIYSVSYTTTLYVYYENGAISPSWSIIRMQTSEPIQLAKPNQRNNQQ